MFRSCGVRKFRVGNGGHLALKLSKRLGRTHDSLLSRLSNDDDMEKSLSTFANEMASCAMILGTCSNLALQLYLWVSL